jgi:hypothetical protein
MGQTEAEGAEEVTGGGRKLRNEGLHDLYSMSKYLSDEIKEDEMHGACAMHGGEEKCKQGFVGRT